MAKFIFPSSPAWGIERFHFEITTTMGQISIQINDKQQVIVTIEKEGFQIEDHFQAILWMLGFRKTENTDEWYSDTYPDEVAIAKAYALYAVKLLEPFIKEITDDKRQADEPLQKIL